ncbi:hypothetical protein [Streptomyces rimosus]|uniref:hypothetical protein n=1 Tax=Streptomyces rimosus TaxID=1927 RepID=UPI0004C6BB79|nr:hypothetical protein [Streptomyces rimosus]
MLPGVPLGGYASTHRMTNALERRPAISLADGVRRYARWLDKHPRTVPEQWQSPEDHPAGA